MPEQSVLPRDADGPQSILKGEDSMHNPTKPIDKEVLDGYNRGVERGRLHTGIGLIELARTKELLLERLPKPPAVLYDIGGGYGEYAWWLASLGYEVHLFDLAETNIRLSAELAAEYPGVSLCAAEVCDARDIPRPAESADAVLLMGPLYHIPEKAERIAAVRESLRLLKPGGLLFTAAITPYATLLWATSVFGRDNRLIAEDAFMRMVERELTDGEHIRPPAAETAYRGIGRSHFHSAAELRAELTAGGFSGHAVHGVVGAAWLAPALDTLWADPDAREALLRTVRLLDGREDILGLSTHLLCISEKP